MITHKNAIRLYMIFVGKNKRIVLKMLTWPFRPETYDWLVALWHPHVFRPVSALLRHRTLADWSSTVSEKNAPRRLSKRLEAPEGKSEAETENSACRHVTLPHSSDVRSSLNEEGALGSSFRIPHGLKVENANTHDSYPTIMLPGTPNHPSAQRIPYIWHKNCVGL